MSSASLIARHSYIESVAPEDHHAVNLFLRRLYWGIVGGVVAGMTLRRLIGFARRRWNGGRSGRPVVGQHVARFNALSDAFWRDLSYRRFAWTGRLLKYLSPPSLGEFLFLCVYWTMLLVMLWTNVIFKSPSPIYGIEWEVVGFRAAWVSTTQLPLVYCTGCRINPISLLTGISHERMNWFHRWAARTFFLTLIVHWAFFYHEWDQTDFVQQEIKMMPMVIWGFAAWGMVGFMVVTGFGFFRGHFYEIWLLTHILSAYLALWLTYTHTHHTTYFVLASAAFVAFDLCGRLILCIIRNVQMFSTTHPLAFGCNATVRMLNDDYILLTVTKISFRWKAGQHIYITIPQLRKVESHPFTIANFPGPRASERDMALVIKPRRGFTRDLARWTASHPSTSLKVLINGPYGNPPPLAGYDTIVLIATGNRASFVVPLLQELASQAIEVAKVSMNLICRELSDVEWYLNQIQASVAAVQLRQTRIESQVHVTSLLHCDADMELVNHIATPSSLASNTAIDATPVVEDEKLPRRSNSEHSSSSDDLDSAHGSEAQELESLVGHDDYMSPQMISSVTTTSDERKFGNSGDTEGLLDHVDATSSAHVSQVQVESHPGQNLPISAGRPSADAMIRPFAVEAHGKVLVVAAVGEPLRCQVSQCVARLNREIVIPALRGREDNTDAGPTSLELWCEANGG